MGSDGRDGAVVGRGCEPAKRWLPCWPIGLRSRDASKAAEDFAAGLPIAAGAFGLFGKKLRGIEFGLAGGLAPGKEFCALPKPGSFGLVGPPGIRLLALLPRLLRPSDAAFFKFAPAPLI